MGSSVSLRSPEDDDSGGVSVILQLESLSKAFGSVVVADKLDLRHRARASALGIIGPNGAGKSSLFNLIAGALKPDSGTIRLAGEDVTTTSAAGAGSRSGSRAPSRSRSPSPISPCSRTCWSAPRIAASAASPRLRSFAARVLEQSGLLPLANRRAGTLTLLERKRLELARALATEPRVLLLDEIAGGLTESECQVLVDTIRDVRSTGVTIVWIEHVVHALLAVVDRLLVLNFGRKIADGEPRAVIASPQVREIYLGIEA